MVQCSLSSHKLLFAWSDKVQPGEDIVWTPGSKLNQAIKALFESRSRINVTSELRKSKDQEHVAEI